ncbi:sodium:alanine symporter [Pseudoalteromonas sp. NBT06-2]|uniref:alanine/glycine:cation symporter family protein n=1 Tax=Pseudoalteromonas sp. NBT06-2 TaxID=2025950 RepID=UPI000BA72406|nr:alanine/glycine:cation symporter family protein [Pseudoalteromonas sp. NBT06-2]PAJ73304.1 sodium:alanine symporter [Pseudoalteromonas sp. NBT06-2]
MEEVVTFLNNIIWSPVLIYLCLGTGLFFSVLTRFVQIRLFSEMFRLLLSGKSSDKGISSFQALAVSLSGRVGTGNIAGVAAAIGFGGPGAVFWMWVVAFLGSATAYIESTLAQIYKEEVDGQYRGGPAYYIEKAMGQKWYAWFFAIATIIATGLLLPMVQSNGIGEAVVQVFGQGTTIDTALGTVSMIKVYVATGIVMLLGFIIFGGVKRIANFTQVVVPFMALAYIIIAVVIIVLNIDRVPEIFMLIIGDAFTPMAGVGAAIGWGVKRGVYSNEAGQGTGPHAAAAAEVEHPAQQGLVQAFSVYIDTIFVCSATAFMILITGMYNVHVPGAEETFIIQNIAADVAANSPAYTQFAVESVFTGVGKPFIALALFFFAFTTILAYYFIAENNVYYIKRTLKLPGLTFTLKILIMLATFYGTVKAADLAWALGDIGVGMMAWLNIIGILIIFFMAKPAIKALKDYEAQKQAGVENYTFDPKALGIEKADFWEKRIKNKQNEQ